MTKLKTTENFLEPSVRETNIRVVIYGNFKFLFFNLDILLVLVKVLMLNPPEERYLLFFNQNSEKGRGQRH